VDFAEDVKNLRLFTRVELGSGMRKQTIGSRSRIGLSVKTPSAAEILFDAEFIQRDKARVIGDAFKEKI
jgi:hypothetical protein